MKFTKRNIDENVKEFFLFGEGDSDTPQPDTNSNNCQNYGVCDTHVDVFCAD